MAEVAATYGMIIVVTLGVAAISFKCVESARADLEMRAECGDTKAMAKARSMLMWLLAVSGAGLGWAWGVQVTRLGGLLMFFGLPNRTLMLALIPSILLGFIIHPVARVLSDNLTWSFGRRRPFLIGAALLLIVCDNFIANAYSIGSSAGDDSSAAGREDALRPTAASVAVVSFWMAVVSLTCLQVIYESLILDLVLPSLLDEAFSRSAILESVGHLGACGFGFFSLAKFESLEHGDNNFIADIRVQFLLASGAAGAAILMTCMFVHENVQEGGSPQNGSYQPPAPKAPTSSFGYCHRVIVGLAAAFEAIADRCLLVIIGGEASGPAGTHWRCGPLRIISAIEALQWFSFTCVGVWAPLFMAVDMFDGDPTALWCEVPSVANETSFVAQYFTNTTNATYQEAQGVLFLPAVKPAFNLAWENPNAVCGPDPSRRGAFEVGLHLFCLAAAAAVLVCLAMQAAKTQIEMTEQFERELWAGCCMALSSACVWLALLPHLPLWLVWCAVAMAFFQVFLLFCGCAAMFAIIIPLILLAYAVMWATHHPLPHEHIPEGAVPNIFSNPRALAAAGLVMIVGLPWAAHLTLPHAALRKAYPGDAVCFSVVNVFRCLAQLLAALTTPLFICLEGGRFSGAFIPAAFASFGAGVLCLFLDADVAGPTRPVGRYEEVSVEEGGGAGHRASEQQTAVDRPRWTHPAASGQSASSSRGAPDGGSSGPSEFDFDSGYVAPSAQAVAAAADKELYPGQ